MVKLVDDALQTTQEFLTDEALFRHLRGRANEHWQFAQYPPQTLKAFVEKMEGRSFVHTAWRACQSECDMLVVGLGYRRDPKFFVVTPDLNIAALEREWSKRFCAAHKLRILIM